MVLGYHLVNDMLVIFVGTSDVCLSEYCVKTGKKKNTGLAKIKMQKIKGF